MAGAVTVGVLASSCGEPAQDDTGARIRRDSDKAFHDLDQESGPQSDAKAPALLRERPTWLDSGADPRFPATGFLTGVGTAPLTRDTSGDFQKADAQARAELAKSIRVKVQSSCYDSIQAVSSGQKATQTSQLAWSTGSQVDMELAGVRIVERYRDGKQACSLAVLDRDVAARLLAERMEMLAAEVDAGFEIGSKALAASQAVDGLQCLEKSRQAFVAYAVAKAERTVVAPEAPAAPSPKTSAVDLAKAIDDAILKIRTEQRKPAAPVAKAEDDPSTQPSDRHADPTPRLGMTLVQHDIDLRVIADIPNVQHYFLVKQVEGGSVAARAGVQEGDVLVGVNSTHYFSEGSFEWLDKQLKSMFDWTNPNLVVLRGPGPPASMREIHLSIK